MSPVKKIDFASLTLCEALDLAILIEEESKERYVEFADNLTAHATKEAAGFFLMMAGNEEKHRAQLSERRRKLFGNAKLVLAREQIFDVEAPDSSEARAFMSPRQALTTALHAEQKAFEFFTKAVEFVKDTEVRALFQELAQEESEHEHLVKGQLDKLPPDPPHADEDFADEPVEQD